jgi:hypothetical protein
MTTDLELALDDLERSILLLEDGGLVRLGKRH